MKEKWDMPVKKLLPPEEKTPNELLQESNSNRSILSKILTEIEDLRGELQETRNDLESVKESLRMHLYKDDPRWSYENT